MCCLRFEGVCILHVRSIAGNTARSHKVQNECKVGLRRLTTVREVDPLSLIFHNFNMPGLHWAETVLEFSENKTLLQSLHTDRCHQQRGLDKHHIMGGIIYIHVVQSRGQDRTLRHPCLHFPWLRHFPFTKTLSFHCERKELMSLLKLVKNPNLSKLYSKPGCHMVSKAFSMSKNTMAIDILLLKLRVMRPHTWNRHAVTCMETKLPCVKQASFFSVFLDYF
jgi:hypothetical protein